MIAGVIVGGTTTKAVVIRGLGPSLATVDRQSASQPDADDCQRATVSLSRKTTTGKATLNAGQLQSLNLAPTNTLEAAVLLTAAPGNYTAILSDVNGNSGIGLVEVYNVTN